jgi:two-component system alkaline phosphatase synthesis response regulator PhoP
MSARILIVEDDPGLRMTLVDRMKNEGYDVEAVADGEQGLERAAERRHDLILLDLMLPGRGGFEVCQELRRRRVATPILMLTARGQVVDKVVGLRLGADDYLTKPFEMAELLARIEARLRPRESAAEATRYRFGNVELDVRKAEALKDGEPVALSAKEFQLLKYFVENRGATLSRDELLDKVWGYQAMPSTRTVDVHVAWLRRKLEADAQRPRFILTVHGLGYKFAG